MARPTRAIERALAWLALLAVPLVTAGAPVAASTDAAADIDWVLARIVRPPPAQTPFLELRGSAMLQAPLRVVGEYRRLEGDALVRDVLQPYRETTTITDDEVVIERAGRTARRFPMSRAPELAGLRSGFGALLKGDRATLERHYEVAVDGPRNGWVLTLVPRDAALAARLHEVVLRGRGAELRCIETWPAGGDAQRSLLAGAVLEAGDAIDAAGLAAVCHGDTNG
ncbi:LolA-related protein [Marilutibacter penaei]|uniref:LolA-related protein n=1 Tax=Marilutibacter penaei TaxID=2759900 RepID=UPI001C71BB83|nr:LolA-related protein [Lysobacter penaei]